MEQENEHVFTAQEMLDVAENEVYIIDAATFKDCHLADTRVRQMLRLAARIIEADSKIERVIRDAVVDYNEMFPSAPNDDCERELRERAGRANAWLGLRRNRFVMTRINPTSSCRERRRKMVKMTDAEAKWNKDDSPHFLTVVVREEDTK